MHVALRPARPDDAEEMARWFDDLAGLAAWGGPDVAFPLTRDQLAAWLDEGAAPRPRVCFTAVDDGDNPVGHVQFLRDPPRRWARLGRFGVAPALRGRGFGRALFEEAMRMAFVDFRVETLALVVIASNVPARGLYLSCGFRDVETLESLVVGGQPYAPALMTLSRGEWASPAASKQAVTVN
jgi:RimJ/RimL family protein N-acetyltransferase